jgi:flavin reductase (DIM6/NTAB) family NADH-FMN oxidoreductase RutF/rubredoxin
MPEDSKPSIDYTALNNISYGLYVVSSVKDGRPNGQICNTAIQVTSDPARIAVCLNKGNLTHEYVEASGLFSVSILGRDTSMPFIGLFGFKSGREVNKFESVKHRKGAGGVPVVIENALSVIEAGVRDRADTGTHTLFVADVLAAEHLVDGEVLTYADYKLIKKGLVPKTAPSYTPPQKGEEAKEKKVAPSMQRYVCGVCGHVYDPKEGDPGNGIPPGTAFEDLPADWQCPVCGAPRTEFSPEK